MRSPKDHAPMQAYLFQSSQKLHRIKFLELLCGEMAIPSTSLNPPAGCPSHDLSLV